jgi:hypothetical protein
MSNKLERMWKEALENCLRNYPAISLKQLRKTMESSVRMPCLQQQELEMFPTQLRYSVTRYVDLPLGGTWFESRLFIPKERARDSPKSFQTNASVLFEHRSAQIFMLFQYLWSHFIQTTVASFYSLICSPFMASFQSHSMLCEPRSWNRAVK